MGRDGVAGILHRQGRDQGKAMASATEQRFDVCLNPGTSGRVEPGEAKHIRFSVDFIVHDVSLVQEVLAILERFYYGEDNDANQKKNWYFIEITEKNVAFPGCSGSQSDQILTTHHMIAAQEQNQCQLDMHPS